MASVADSVDVQSPSSEPEVNKLFRMVMKHKGSDLHLKVGLPGVVRLGGVLRQMQMPPISSAEMERLLFPLLTPKQRSILDEEGGVDFAHIVSDGDLETRFRVNLFKARGRLSLVARRVNNTIPNFEALGLPPVIAEITQYEQGIIILAGVTGSGKSTTIASMLQYINERERMHIVTIEDPIEFTFKDDKSIINQREVGIDVIDWHKALKHAVRQDPDIILVGRDARPRDLQRRLARRRDRPPGLRHDPRLQRPVDYRPDPRPLPPRDAPAPAAEPGFQPQGDHRAEAAADDQGMAGQGDRPRPDHRDHADQPDRPQADPQRGGQQAWRRDPHRQGRGDAWTSPRASGSWSWPRRSSARPPSRWLRTSRL